MKKCILFFLLISLCGMVRAQNGVRFIDYKTISFKDVLAKAKAENKPIFVDIWTVWCGPCKILKAETFTRSDVGDFFNKNFINLEFDAEDPNWIAVTEKYQATAFPTILFLSPDGKVLWSGDNLQIGVGAEDADGKPFAATNLLCQGQLVLDYLKMPEDEFFTRDNWEKIKKYCTTSSSQIFESMIACHEKLEALYGKEVSRMMMRSIDQDAANIYRKATGKSVLNKEKYDRILRITEKVNPAKKAEVRLGMDVEIAQQEKDWDKMVSLLEKARQDGVVGADMLGWYAEELIGTGRKDLRGKGQVWIQEALKVVPADSRAAREFKRMLDDLKK